MENIEEEKKAGEEISENPIQIIVTEDESDQSGSPQETSESAEEKGQKDDKDVASKEGTQKESTADESGDLQVPPLDVRRKSTLRVMDEKYSWLSALEEKKYMNLETDFISKIQYVAVSNHCQKYLDELSAEESMMPFRIEFSKLFDKFRTIFVGSQRLLNKVSEIKSCKNITDTENRKIKIKLCAKENQIEKLTESLNNLQSDLLKMEKEKKYLQAMFSEVRSAKVDDSYKQDQEIKKKTVTRDDEETEEKIRQLQEQKELLSGELEFTKQRETKYQKKIQQADNTNTSLQKELNSVKYELQKQTTRAEKAETVISQNTADLKNKNDTIKNLADETKQLRSDLEKAKSDYRRMLKVSRKSQKELEGMAQVIEKLRRDVDIREDRMKMLTNQKNSLAVDLGNKQGEVYTLKGNIANVTKEKNSLARRVGLLEERCAEAESKLESAKNENASQLKELDTIRKEVEESDNKTRELTKQKDSLAEEVLKHEQAITDLRSDFKVLQEKCHSAEKELENTKLLAENLKENIRRLEKIKERLAEEEMELNRKILDMRGEIKRLEMQISDMKKAETKLQQQLDDERAKYKLLVDDERHFRNLLAESRHETEELTNQVITLKKYFEQLQSYNQNLDDKCKNLNLKVKNITEQLGNAKESHKQEVKSKEELNVKLKHKDDHEQLLLKNITDRDNNIQMLKRKVKNLNEERNVQNSKLIEKEREIHDLKENIRLLQQEQNTLDRSLNDRIKDIKLLKLQLSNMNKNNALKTEQVEFIDTTRNALADTQNKLLEEKLKSKALEREVQRPVNLHRWRILEGIDPDRAQLVTKNQGLQEQLLKKMTELDSKEVELREKGKHAQELQEKLDRRLESDVQEKLWTCKKELSARIERIKCLTAENSMFQTLCGKYEKEIMTLKNHLLKYKKAETFSRHPKKSNL